MKMTQSQKVFGVTPFKYRWVRLKFFLFKPIDHLLYKKKWEAYSRRENSNTTSGAHSSMFHIPLSYRNKLRIANAIDGARSEKVSTT